jgi:hypothetical protein
MGEFIGQLPGEGRQPRVMPGYPGTLLHRMRQMSLDDVFDALGYLTGDPRARQAVEWLGGTWGHAVAPSTPPRTSGCTCAPGSTISRPSSAWRRSGASADSPPPRWRCPTTPMSPARSSAPWLTAATRGCWSRSTPRSSPTAAASAAPAGVHRLALQPVLQHRVRERFQPARVQAGLPLSSASEYAQFSVDGGSWTAAAGPTTCRGCAGYGNVLAPMQPASTLFS